MVATIFHSQSTSDRPLPYTASPWSLMWEDILLVVRTSWSIPWVLLPLKHRHSNELDELHPSLTNIANVVFQAVLSLVQILFLLSVPALVICLVPTLWVCVYISGFLWFNRTLCNLILNRKPSVLVSKYPKEEAPEHKHEHWVYINGIACGQTWLQCNIDRLAYTFGRKITGVHNPSSGLVFDIIESLIQRDFSYATRDVREAYALLRAALLNPDYTKVVLISHSQGGIESGLIADWLLDEIPQGLLRKLEIYTFGNAANHFNNPYRALPAAQETAPAVSPQSQHPSENSDNTILHIEHYANSYDFVSLWGALNFSNIPNRFMGHVFVRQGSGHLFNQHYLGTMFPLGPDNRVLDSNTFMDTEIDFPGSTVNSSKGTGRRVKVRELSRLWLYRNGGSPK
ncbi:uncharacterized protein BDW70DRAFT_26498 [Aspergillus foveolatus]|uniref:uncharacterized protein n=1 Tax=Aspergillus foveolatus TaxID=210207 RepID=UPI003CCDC692